MSGGSRRDDPDIEGHWAGVAKAWPAIRFGGYGEAVWTLAKTVYGMEEIGPRAIREA